MPVDPTVLADRLGLSIVTQELTEDFSVFGQIFFQDCDTEVFNSDTGEMEPAHFLAKTIAVDPKAFHLRNLGSENVDCVVAVYIGMNLPPELSNVLISRSGFTLRLAQSETHLMYNFFLNHLYMSSIHECNDMLVAKNLPVMTGTE